MELKTIDTDLPAVPPTTNNFPPGGVITSVNDEPVNIISPKSRSPTEGVIEIGDSKNIEAFAL